MAIIKISIMKTRRACPPSPPWWALDWTNPCLSVLPHRYQSSYNCTTVPSIYLILDPGHTFVDQLQKEFFLRFSLWFSPLFIKIYDICTWHSAFQEQWCCWRRFFSFINLGEPDRVNLTESTWHLKKPNTLKNTLGRFWNLMNSHRLGGVECWWEIKMWAPRFCGFGTLR